LENLNRCDKLVNRYERTNFIKPVIELKTLQRCAQNCRANNVNVAAVQHCLLLPDIHRQQTHSTINEPVNRQERIFPLRTVSCSFFPRMIAKLPSHMNYKRHRRHITTLCTYSEPLYSRSVLLFIRLSLILFSLFFFRSTSLHTDDRIRPYLNLRDSLQNRQTNEQSIDCQRQNMTDLNRTKACDKVTSAQFMQS